MTGRAHGCLSRQRELPDDYRGAISNQHDHPGGYPERLLASSHFVSVVGDGAGINPALPLIAQGHTR